MRALLIGAIVLIALGVLSLAYYTSPLRIMLLDTVGQKLHFQVPMMGGVAILIGALILFAIRSNAAENK
jgi:UDP-N-acetylmuramyl pentapeptide phosphotransferase/UDP-N-acetylglucosamine-1-phosphate transferase